MNKILKIISYMKMEVKIKMRQIFWDKNRKWPLSLAKYHKNDF